MGYTRPTSIVEITNSMFETIDGQRLRSITRIEQTANETKKWFQTAFEAQRRQLMEPAANQSFEHDRQPAKKKPKVNPGLPSETTQWVYSLKVKELSGILRQRGLDGNGIKKILQQRLLESLESEMMEEQQKTKQEEMPNNKGMEPSATSSKDPMGDATMEDIQSKPLEAAEPEPMEVEMANASSSSARVETVEPGTDQNGSPMKGVETNEEQSKEETFSSPQRRRSPLKIVTSGVKSALKALSPVKQKSVNTLVQKIESATKSNSNQTFKSSYSSNPAKDEQTVSVASSRDDGSQSNADSKSLQSSSSARKFAGPTRLLNTGGVAPQSGTIATIGANGTVMSKSIKASQEARRAKLQEIRNKSKPAVSSTTSINSVPTLTKVKTFAEGKDGKRNLIAQQIREKAIAKTFEPSKENSPNKANNEADAKPAPSAASLFKTKHTTAGQSKVGEVKPVSAFAAGTKDLTPSSAKSNPSSMLSPMDTYELSDREQSDESDSENEEEEYSAKPKKRIPAWAKRDQLMPALEHQFTNKLHDPDQIFGEVQTCDLGEIFDKKKARYQRRTSSGNWAQDRVTAAEKLAYKRGEGFAQPA